MSRLVLAVSVVALVILFLGSYGFISYSTSQRAALQADIARRQQARDAEVQKAQMEEARSEAVEAEQERKQKADDARFWAAKSSRESSESAAIQSQMNADAARAMAQRRPSPPQQPRVRYNFDDDTPPATEQNQDDSDSAFKKKWGVSRSEADAMSQLNMGRLNPGDAR